MDGTLESACSRLDLSKTTKFRLAPGEELIVCPYDMSHIVTNHRMMVHILKCRRNYEKAMKSNDDMVQMVACKYNWNHQVPFPELMYHEMTCGDRLTLITHIIEFSETDPRNPNVVTQVTRDIYVTKGVPFVEVRPLHNLVIPEDSVISSHLMPRRMVAAIERETLDPPQFRTKTVPKASHITVRSIVSTGSKSSAPAATFYGPGQTGPSGSVNGTITNYQGDSSSANANHPLRSKPAPRPNRTGEADPGMGQYYFDANQPEAEEDKDKYEWENDPYVQPYDPSKKFETEMLLKYPPNLSKSERKAWKNANVAKVRELYGGNLIHMTPAEPPRGVLPRSANPSLFNSN